MTDLRSLLFDAQYLGDLRQQLADAAPQAPAAALLLIPSPAPDIASLGVFSGSFNPLTLAHCAVVAAAAATRRFDLIAYTLSTLTTDKEQVTGVALDDRLAVLLAHVSDRPGEGVLLLNRGLYVEQARALRAAFPTLRELRFIVGFDKIVQVFDPRYYADRDAALEELYTLAGFLVAPRAGAGRVELDALLNQEENRRFAGGVQFLDVPDGDAEASSTLLRQRLGSGDAFPDGLPAAAAALIAFTGAYRGAGPRGVEPYASRRALLEAVWNGQMRDEGPAALARRWTGGLTGRARY